MVYMLDARDSVLVHLLLESEETIIKAVSHYFAIPESDIKKAVRDYKLLEDK